METGAIWANLVIAANGATSLAGRSKGLSFPEDREHFHWLRSQAKAILIGGATFRSEPYENVPIALYIATRNSGAMGGDVEPGQYRVAPLELVAIAKAEVGSPLLIEGGVNFLTPLLLEAQIDQLFLTRSNTLGDGNSFDESLLDRYRRVAANEFSSGVLERWQPELP